jgi:hypothetical protein
MRIFQVFFKHSYESKIVFAPNRLYIWNTYPDVASMFRVDVV